MSEEIWSDCGFEYRGMREMYERELKRIYTTTSDGTGKAKISGNTVTYVWTNEGDEWLNPNDPFSIKQDHNYDQIHEKQVQKVSKNHETKVLAGAQRKFEEQKKANILLEREMNLFREKIRILSIAFIKERAEKIKKFYDEVDQNVEERLLLIEALKELQYEKIIPEDFKP